MHKKTGALSGFFLQNLFSAYFTSRQYGANHDSFKLYKLCKSSNILFFDSYNVRSWYGFFIGSIDIIFYDNLIAENDKHSLIDNNLFHIFSEGEIETNVFTLVDKNFIRKNDYEIISKKTNHSCYNTGIHTDTCCSKHDNLKSNKVFHIKTTL